MDIQLYNGDCLEVMRQIPDKSIDLIVCDPPFATTANEWDNLIDFKELWAQYERIIKDDRAIVLFGSGSFTYKLISSNEDLYRYKWIWYKTKRGNFVNANNRPMTAYEEIMVFSKAVTANGSKNKMLYNPQGLIPKKTVRHDNGTRFGTMAGKRPSHQETTISEYTNYPCDVLEFASETSPLHPTQKPIPLIEYLIRTYSNEGDTVLDNCAGSFTTAIAAMNANRNFIGIELEKKYFDIGVERVKNRAAQIDMFNLEQQYNVSIQG
jgi:site-specific DNA-methyltransferase (adenine-specific)